MLTYWTCMHATVSDESVVLVELRTFSCNTTNVHCVHTTKIASCSAVCSGGKVSVVTPTNLAENAEVAGLVNTQVRALAVLNYPIATFKSRPVCLLGYLPPPTVNRDEM